MKVLVTGATGYIGGRLVPRLLERGHQVRVLVRDAGRIAGRPWANAVDIATGDLSRPATLEGLCDGIEAAYYLVHSMYGGAGYARRDRKAARNFIAVTRASVQVAGPENQADMRKDRRASTLRHVIYLGGLMPQGTKVSQHLSSRAQVGAILREHLPTTEFRAGPIIGSGSASFEMVRYLTERLPVMVAPRWILNEVQPISVRDVLDYLLAALEREPMGVVDVGADRLTFKEMMERFAEVRGLRRVILPVPVLAPRLAALWIGLVTPIPNSLAVPLVEGVVEPVLAETERAESLFPDIRPLPYRQAVERALNVTERNQVQTRWSGALGHSSRDRADRTRTHLIKKPESGAPRERRSRAPGRPEVTGIPRTTHEMSDREGLIREVHTVRVNLPPETVFRSFTSLGGRRGWLVWNWAWEVRGFLDRLVGGPGLRRGRRHPTELLPGEALDFWRVETVEPPRLLRLRAEMKVPGRAWIQWEAVPEGEGTRLVQTALFEPVGLSGTLYWYSLYPIHKLIFRDLTRSIAREARWLPAAPELASTPAPGESA
jgi:uncharacterized protein YbjT (DUF2867 family)